MVEERPAGERRVRSREGSELLTPEQLGERWQVSTKTLSNWRYLGTGPAAFKFGGIVRYRVEDVFEFEEEHMTQGESVPLKHSSV